jgi:hypothetical protein
MENWIGPACDDKFKWLRGVEIPRDAMDNDQRSDNRVWLYSFYSLVGSYRVAEPANNLKYIDAF